MKKNKYNTKTDQIKYIYKKINTQNYKQQLENNMIIFLVSLVSHFFITALNSLRTSPSLNAPYAFL